MGLTSSLSFSVSPLIVLVAKTWLLYCLRDQHQAAGDVPRRRRGEVLKFEGRRQPARSLEDRSRHLLELTFNSSVLATQPTTTTARRCTRHRPLRSACAGYPLQSRIPAGRMRMRFSKAGAAYSAEAAVAVVAVGWVANTAGVERQLQQVSRSILEASCGLTPTFELQHLTSSSAGDITGRLMLVPQAIQSGFVAATNAVKRRYAET